MVDYDRSTGEGGVMRIRDDGTTVSFMVRAGYTSSFSGGVPYGWVINGSNVQLSAGNKFAYPTGRPWVTVRSWTVTTTQTVTFRMGASGTSGLGGPTNHSATITRATVPGVPRTPSIDNIGPTSMTIKFTAPASNGGAAINGYRVRYGKSNPITSGDYVEFITTSGTNPVSGLDPGSEYFVQVWARNSVGFGPATAVFSARTLGPIRIKIEGQYRFGIPYVKTDGIYKMTQPMVKSDSIYKKTG